MAKTGAERQAAYRARQSEASDQRRISTWINSDAALALEALANRYGVTMREVIEILLLKESGLSGKSLISNSSKAEKKPRKKLLLPSNGVAKRNARVDKTDAGALRRNAVAVKPVETEQPPKADKVSVPHRGEQFSLEL